MVSSQDQLLINDNLRNYFDSTKKHHLKLPGHNRDNSLEHELKKYEVAMKLEREGRTVIVEGILTSGLRPDLVVLDLPEPLAYEIVMSESEESIKSKQSAYPFEIITIDCKKKRIKGEEIVVDLHLKLSKAKLLYNILIKRLDILQEDPESLALANELLLEIKRYNG